MAPEDKRNLVARAQGVIDRIAAAHTPQNLERLQAECAKRGCKLTGSIRRKTGFAFVDPNGNKLSGLSLASVEDLLADPVG